MSLQPVNLPSFPNTAPAYIQGGSWFAKERCSSQSMRSEIPFSFGFATSAVPGWHTTIYPPYFVSALISIIVLLLLTIGYWLLSKRVDKTSWTLFVIHFILTIPTFIFLKFPSVFLDKTQTNQEELLRNLSLQIKLVPVAWILFMAGQILFIIYCIKTIKNRAMAR